MRLRRRHLRLLQIALLLLALANAAFAQGDAWRCDTGERCGIATAGCCCPPERQPAAGDEPAEAGCCSKPDTQSAASPSRSCCASHTLAGKSEPGETLAATPNCRCSFTVSATPDVALEPATAVLPLIEVQTPASAPVLTLPSPVAFEHPTDDLPPSPSVPLSPSGARAPPAC
jgi:hypothetical protein